MPDFLIALGILVLLGVGVTVVVRVRQGAAPKDERDPEQPRNVERGRAQSEAKAADDAPLTEAEEVEAAELVAFIEEISTGEQLMVMAFDLDPLGAPIPDDRPVAEPDLFHDVTANWLAMFTWTAAPDARVPLTSVPTSAPAPLELESFTTGWTRAEIADILAKGRAGASR